MAKPSSSKSKSTAPPIGEVLRQQRIEVLQKSVRDVAHLLGSAPIHVSDIETGKRTPSEELLLKIAKVYGIPEAKLRAGFSRPEAIVIEVASESDDAAAKVPALMRKATGFSRKQWDALLKSADEISKQKDE
jgi:transcriptional regulator with XRE-family HTH domain